MKPEHERYILENADKQSPAAIARHLGLKERKVAKFLKMQSGKADHNLAAPPPIGADQSAADKFFNSIHPAALFITLFTIAFAIKLVILFLFQKSILANLLILDMSDYDARAIAIAQGHLIGKTAFEILPFYAYFLGFIYFLAGHSFFIIRLIQIIVGSVSCILVFNIARHMFSPSVGIIAFAAMLLFKEFYCYEMLLMPTTIGVFFYLTVIALAFSVLKQPRIRMVALLGAITGFSALNRAYMLFLIPVIPAALFFSLNRETFKKRTICVVVFIVFAVAAVSTATIHNYLASGDFVPITTHGGINFYVGNNPAADGLNIKAPFPIARGSREMLAAMHRAAEKAAGHAMTSSQVSAYWSSQAASFIFSSPQAFAALLFVKLNAFLCGFDLSDIVSPAIMAEQVPLLDLFFLSFRFLMPFALIGIALTLSRRREFILIYAVIIGHIVSIMLFIVVGRYRLAIAPFFLIFWSACLVYLIKCISFRRLSRFAAIAAAIALIFIYLNNKSFGDRYNMNPGANCAFIGGYFLDKGQYGDAIKLFRQSVSLEPKRAEAHNMLGLGLAMAGRYDEAQGEYEKAILLNPELYQANNNLGDLFEKLSMRNKALEQYKKSVAINPAQPEVKRRMDALANI